VYQGVQLAKKRKITYLNIMGDSKNIIRYFVYGSSPKDPRLNVLIECTCISLSNIFVQFFHLFRKDNTVVDEIANKAIGLSPVSLGVIGEVHFETPP
jgi:hypothetical protein